MRLQTTSQRLFAALISALFAVCAVVTHARTQATTTTTNETIPFASTLPNPCNGDAVTFQGTMHVTNTAVTNASGGFTLKTHVNYQDVTGTGAPSGLNYRVATVTNETQNDNDSAQENTTVIQTVKLIAQGSALDAFLRIVLHVTVNANGETTSTVEEVMIECRVRR